MEPTKNAEVAPCFKSKHNQYTKGWHADRAEFWLDQYADLTTANETLATHAKDAEIDRDIKSRRVKKQDNQLEQQDNQLVNMSLKLEQRKRHIEIRDQSIRTLTADKKSLEKNVDELTRDLHTSHQVAYGYQEAQDSTQLDLDKALRIIGQLTLEAACA